MEHADLRLIGHFKGALPGPCIVVVAGLHGNEPSGIVALQQLLQWLETQNAPFHGEIHCFRGNLAALKTQTRYIDWDLNRLWTHSNFSLLENDLQQVGLTPLHEFSEMLDLRNAIESHFAKQPVENCYLIDLHTTSGEAPAFIPANDTAVNRRFLKTAHVPVILGVEEQINGGMLGYFSERGIVAIGFEGGQHANPITITRHVEFMHWVLQEAKAIPDHDRYPKTEVAVSGNFEIKYLYTIQATEQFVMDPGFSSFQAIRKGQRLAQNQHGPILSPMNGYIFMPLYQKSGSDGFFIVQKIAALTLFVSNILYALQPQKWLHVLPGIGKYNKQWGAYKIPSFFDGWFTSSFMRRAGFRKRKEQPDGVVYSFREF